ncbi:MAG: hypothetical protein U1A27_06090 [Phycisphaerae bacterium]
MVFEPGGVDSGGGAEQEHGDEEGRFAGEGVARGRGGIGVRGAAPDEDDREQDGQRGGD